MTGGKSSSEHGGRRPGAGRPRISIREIALIGSLCDGLQMRIAERRAMSVPDLGVRELQRRAEGEARKYVSEAERQERLQRDPEEHSTPQMRKSLSQIKRVSSQMDALFGAVSAVPGIWSSRLQRIELKKPKDSRDKVLNVISRAWNVTARRWNKAHPKAAKNERLKSLSPRAVDDRWKAWRALSKR